VSGTESVSEKFDYIVVGAGSAGSVTANRLSAVSSNRVILLEAGGTDKKFWIQTPLGYGKTFTDPSVNWMYHTAPIEMLENRRSYWPRGKVLGGSSSINAMVYVRGQKEDYDDWADLGCKGWGWSDVKPYFEKLEDLQWVDGSSDSGTHALAISNNRDRLHPLCSKFIDAGKALGAPFNNDLHSEHQEGVGYYSFTIKDGQRMSAAKAYLDPVRSRPNLVVEDHACVKRLLFDGPKVVGVEYVKNDKLHVVRCAGEVILCAGAIGSPQLLQLSGIGPEKLLKQLEIPIVVENNEVGANLQDHLSIGYTFEGDRSTINNLLASWPRRIFQGVRYILSKTGPLSLSVNQAGGFIRTDMTLCRPNMQLYFQPASYSYVEDWPRRPLMRPDSFSGFSISAQPLRPKSRGTVMIKTRNQDESPEIKPEYFSVESDLDEMLIGAKTIRKLVSLSPLAEVIKREVTPGPSIRTDEQLVSDIRRRADTVYHPVGTCRMGHSVSQTVVDLELTVRGTKNLRVVDASVFPKLVSGNTNGPTIMLAEKASELILKRASSCS